MASSPSRVRAAGVERDPRCLTFESEERETWTADVLAAQALGLGRTRHLTVTYQVHQRERRETFSRVLGTRQEIVTSQRSNLDTT